ncbi:MAG: hypothetical protein ABFR65_12670 [Pseudomonadota bacterium]
MPFITGPRKDIVEVIESRGDLFKSNPIKNTDHLLIGEIGSRDWIHSIHGRKIEKALELSESGTGISIISEKHWASIVGWAPPTRRCLSQRYNGGQCPPFYEATLVNPHSKKTLIFFSFKPHHSTERSSGDSSGSSGGSSGDTVVLVTQYLIDSKLP